MAGKDGDTFTSSGGRGMPALPDQLKSRQFGAESDSRRIRVPSRNVRFSVSGSAPTRCVHNALGVHAMSYFLAVPVLSLKAMGWRSTYRPTPGRGLGSRSS